MPKLRYQRLIWPPRCVVLPDGQLTATKNIVLNQLTFGDKVEGAPASLPVRLAVALLADRNSSFVAGSQRVCSGFSGRLVVVWPKSGNLRANSGENTGSAIFWPLAFLPLRPFDFHPQTT